MPQTVLLDASTGTYVESLQVNAPGGGWSLHKRRLAGGRRDGVDQILLHNGLLELEIIPTRGLSIRSGRFLSERLGWDSPVVDGPVHPAWVNLASLGGFGWLDGFDELLVRCGLEHNGPPLDSKPFAHTLHGRIGNLPAHRVAIEYPEGDAGTLAIVGEVDEARLFGPQFRLLARLETEPRSNRFRLIDRVTNQGDTPARLALLYHWNWGPPLLGEGSRFLAPARVVCPQTPRAAEGIGHFDTYGPPSPGFTEQVYLFELAAGPDGHTLSMLRDREGTRAVALRYRPDQLRCFTLWKNEGGAHDGYVTGLEPATNYPNPRPFEQAHGRFVELAPGQSHLIETEVEFAAGPEAVSALEREVEAIRGGLPPTIHPAPVEPYAPSR